jgi:hypothetical protein
MFEGGFDAVEKGMQYMKDGRVSAEKIVFEF